MVLGETAEVKRELIQTATNGGPSLVGGPHNHINYTMRPVMSRGRRVEVVIVSAPVLLYSTTLPLRHTTHALTQGLRRFRSAQFACSPSTQSPFLGQ